MAEKKRADFYVDVMGHDINNLNQVILTNLELLQESNRLEEVQNQFLDGAILATKECASTVKNVRALQEIAAGDLEARDVDLDRIIRESIRDAPRPAGKKIFIRYTPIKKATRKDMTIKAMPELKLAFCNLVGNAIRSSGPEIHIDITVSDMTTAADRKCLVTIVTDDGNGIPDRIKEILFMKPGQDANVLQGKGLGLYTANALVEASGGSLKIDDRVPGDYTKGSRTVIILPSATGV
jgi:signal transduction histidine kinase